MRLGLSPGLSRGLFHREKNTKKWVPLTHYLTHSLPCSLPSYLAKLIILFIYWFVRIILSTKNIKGHSLWSMTHQAFKLIMCLQHLFATTLRGYPDMCSLLGGLVALGCIVLRRMWRIWDSKWVIAAYNGAGWKSNEHTNLDRVCCWGQHYIHS